MGFKALSSSGRWNLVPGLALYFPGTWDLDRWGAVHLCGIAIWVGL
jgi:hypothetical protein